MKKRILTILLCVILGIIFSVSVCAVHSGIEETDDWEKLQVIQLLEIMNGDQYGNLNLDSYVTRAEFVKMVINATSLKDSVTNNGMSVFPDVTGAHWAAPYISAAVKSGYINGYLDGTFKPENNVKLEEAVTVILKMLGYTTADFSGTYPDAQLAKYKEISLDTGVFSARGEILTRLDCMRLIYNLLCTKTKAGQFYCTSALGYSVNMDSGTIDLELISEEKMSGPYINTAESPWTDKVSFENSPNITFYLNGQKKETLNAEEYDVYYYSEKAKTVWFYNRKQFGKITAISPNKTSPQTISIQTATVVSLTLNEHARDIMTDGKIGIDDYVMVTFDRDDKVASVYIADNEMYNRFADNDLNLLDEVNRSLSSPVIVTDGNFAEEIPFDIDNSQIICDGEILSKEQIQTGDVIYYSRLANSVWVYRESVSGIYTSVSPSKENPSSVTVGNRNYTLSTDEVKYKFSNYGTFKTNTLITLILGKADEVVDAKAADISVIGDGEKQVSYYEVVNSTLKGPFIVEEDGTLLPDAEINLTNAILYKKNRTVTVSEIMKYDVYYYSSLLNTVWLYNDTKSGTVEAVSPNKVNPTSITLSGSTYTLDSKGASYAFSSLGNFKVGDRVTLFLGKDGGVAGVVAANEINNRAVYGVVIAKGDKTYLDDDGKEYTSGTLTVFTADGNVATFQTEATVKVGIPVKIVVGENAISVTALSSPKSQSYAMSCVEAVKNGNFADDAEIIEYYNESIYAPVLESRISGQDLWYTDILYYELDENGDICVLILENYTGDLVEYGLLTEVKRSLGTYKYILDGIERSIVAGDGKYSGNFTVSEGPAYFAFSGNSVAKIGNIKYNTKISAISGNRVYSAKDGELDIDDNVRIYIFDNSENSYKAITLNELKTGEYTSIVGYLDKDPSNGGRIRVIMASK